MSKTQHKLQNYKDILRRQDKLDDTTCQYCFTSTHDQKLIEQQSGNLKLDENKDFYKPMLKSLKCIKCKCTVHELCQNDNQKKKSVNNFQCIMCTDKEHRERECVVCKNTWGMKKIFYENDQKKFIHLICAYYDSNYYFASFKNKEIIRVSIKDNLEEDQKEDQIENIKKEYNHDIKICIICDKNIQTQAISKCRQCDEKFAHVSCLVYTQRKVASYIEQNNNPNEPENYSILLYPLPCFNLQEPENTFIQGFKDKKEILKLVQSCVDFNVKDRKDKQLQQESFIQYLIQKFDEEFLSAQRAIIPMTCTSCRNQKNNNELYCCGAHLTDKMVFCDICSDWIHADGCDKNQNTTVFESDKIDQNYKYQCFQNQNYDEQYIYICKNCEDIAFYFNKMNNERSIQVINKPKQFLNYFLVSLKLENLLKQKKDIIDEEYNILTKNLFCNVYYKQTDLNLYSRIRKEYINFDQNKDIGFYFQQFTRLFQLPFEDVNLAYQQFENENIQFINEQNKKENEEEDQCIRYKKYKKILKTIIPDSQRFLEEPSQRNLHQIKFNLQQILQNKDIDDNIAFFVQTYTNFMKKYFINPLDNLVNEFDKFFENYSKPFNDFYDNQFEAQLRKCNYVNLTFIDAISLKEYIHCKIPHDKYEDFIEKHNNVEIFCKYIDQIYDSDCSYQYELSQDFQELSVEKIEEIVKRMIDCDFRPSDSKMFQVDNFLNEYMNFQQTKQDIDKLKKQIDKFKIQINEKGFLKESKNLDLFLIREQLENIHFKNKYGQKLIQHSIKTLLDKKQDQQRKDLDQHFVKKCEQNEFQLKQICKNYISQINDEMPIVSQKALMYLKKCNQEYRVEKILQSQKIISKEDLKFLKDAKKDKKHMSKFLQIKIDFFLRQYKKQKELLEQITQQKKEQNLNYIIEEVNNMIKLCNERRINSQILKDYKENINLCQQISYVQNKSYDLSDEGLTDNIIDQLIYFLNQNQQFKYIQDFSIIRPKNFISNKIQTLYNIFREKQIKYMFQPEQKPRLSLANDTNLDDENQFIDTEDQYEVACYDNFKKRVHEFEQKVNETAIYLLKRINIYEQPAKTYERVSEICKESDSYNIDNDQIKEFLQIFSQIRIQLKVQQFIDEFLNINQQDNPHQRFEENSKVYEFLYKKLKEHLKNKIKKRNNNKSNKIQLWNFNDNIYEDQCFKFVKHYECRRELNQDIKKMQSKINNVLNQPLTYMGLKLKEKELDKMIHRIGPFQYLYVDFYKLITKQKKLLCTNTKLYEELQKKILNSNISQLISMQTELEDATKLITNLYVKNDQIENNHAMFTCLIDFIKSNGESFVQFQKFYEEIFIQLKKLDLKDLQSYQLVINLNSLQKEFEQVKKNLKHLQNKIEVHDNFKNYLQFIDKMVDPELNPYKYFCRFDYPSFVNLQDEIRVCKQLLNGQYEEFFRTFYKQEKYGFIGAIHLSDQLKQNIEDKISSVKTLKQFITQIQQKDNQLSLKDKIGFYNYVRQVFKQCVNVIQDEFILEMYKNIENQRKMIQDNQKIVNNELEKLLILLDTHLKQNYSSSSFYIQEIPDLDKKIEEVIQCQGILVLEKIRFLLFCWFYKIIRHLCECTSNNNHRDYVQFYQSKEFRELENLMELKKIKQKIDIRIFCIMGMKYVTNYVLCCVTKQEQEDIIKRWNYKHEYSLDWSRISQKSDFYDKIQSIEPQYRPTVKKFQNLGKRNFLKSVQDAKIYINDNVITYVNTINEQFEDRVTGKDSKKCKVNDTIEIIQGFFQRYILNSIEKNKKNEQYFKQNFLQKCLQYIQKLEHNEISRFRKQIENYFKMLNKDVEAKTQFINKNFLFEFAQKQIKNKQCKKLQVQKSGYDDDTLSEDEQDITSMLSSSFKKKKKEDILNEEEMKIFLERKEKCQPIGSQNLNDCSLYIKNYNQINQLNFKKIQIKERIINDIQFYTNQNIQKLDLSKVELYLDSLLLKNDSLFQKIAKKHLQHLTVHYADTFVLGWAEDNTYDNFLYNQIQSLEKNSYLSKPYLCNQEPVSINFTRFDYLNKELQKKIKATLENDIDTKKIFAFVQFSSKASSYLSGINYDETQIKEEEDEHNIQYQSDILDESVNAPEFQIIYKK